MMMNNNNNNNNTSSFPKIVSCSHLELDESNEAAIDFYDVKFWPYGHEQDDHIFAVAGWSQLMVFRLKRNPRIHDKGGRLFEQLLHFNDTHEGASINSIAWMKDVPTGRPLLCIAGVSPRQIRIMDVGKKEIVRDLLGHGSSINELIVSPTKPNILASCAEDFTIRLWNIDPRLKAQPCVAIFAGEAHRQPILSCAFHPNGRWLLSGAMDTAVALWAVPSDDQLERRGMSSDEPTSVYYPHFFSTEIHHNYIDCLAFYGDLIISRASRHQSVKANEILLWKINGFNADQEPPTDFDIPRPGKDTRSSFPHPYSAPYQRLFTFDTPDTDRFYLRFGLFTKPGLHPMLCMGNQESKYLFWDLQKLEEPYMVDNETSRAARKKAGQKGIAQKVTKRKYDTIEAHPMMFNGLERENSVLSNGSRDTGVSTHSATSTTRELRTVLDTPIQSIKAHQTVTAQNGPSKKHWGSYRITWSPDGHYTIGVGNLSTMVIMYRETLV